VTEQLHDYHYHKKHDTIANLQAEVEALRKRLDEVNEERDMIPALQVEIDTLRKRLEVAHKAEVSQHLHEGHNLHQTIANLRAEIDKREQDKQMQRVVIMDTQAQTSAYYAKTEEYRKKLEKAEMEAETLRVQLVDIQKHQPDDAQV
jgi:DNA repair exonuclease SbcCD ATPase subunit